jgi:hypothetical protein
VKSDWGKLAGLVASNGGLFAAPGLMAEFVVKGSKSEWDLRHDQLASPLNRVFDERSTPPRRATRCM